MIDRRQLGFVAAGGALGVATRWLGLALTGPESHDRVLLGANVIGSAILGALLALRSGPKSRALPDDRFALLGTGYCGGLTTFSSFALTVAEQLDTGQTGSATLALLQTVVAAVLAAGVGYRISLVASGRTGRASRADHASRTGRRRTRAKPANGKRSSQSPKGTRAKGTKSKGTRPAKQTKAKNPKQAKRPSTKGRSTAS